jgi:hypothetical protein
MPVTLKAVCLITFLSVACIGSALGPKSANAQSYGRTTSTGDWMDSNWVDDTGQIGPLLPYDFLASEIVIGRAGYPHASAVASASVDLATDFATPPVAVRIGGQSGDAGELNIQSTGKIRTMFASVGTTGGEGILNVAAGGVFEVQESLEVGTNGRLTSYGMVNADYAYNIVNRGIVIIQDGQFRAWQLYQPSGTLYLNGGVLQADDYFIGDGELHLMGGRIRSNGIQGLHLRNAKVVRSGDAIFEGVVSLDNTVFELNVKDQVWGANLRNGATLSLVSDQWFGTLDMEKSTLKLTNKTLDVDGQGIFNFRKGSTIDRGGASGGITSGRTTIEGAEYTYDGADNFSGILDIIDAATFVANKELRLSAGPNAFLTVTGRGTSFTANAPVSALSLITADYGTTKLFKPVTTQSLSTWGFGSLYIHDTATTELLWLNKDGFVQVSQDNGRTDGLTIGQTIYWNWNSPINLHFDSSLVSGQLDWALRWRGDNRERLTDMLISIIHVQGAPLPVEIIYDPAKYGDFTYIGYIAEVPEPSVWLLVVSVVLFRTERSRIFG